MTGWKLKDFSVAPSRILSVGACLVVLALAGCNDAVDEPYETAIQAACAKQFPHHTLRRWQCVDIGRYAHLRDQRVDAMMEADRAIPTTSGGR